MTFIRYSLFKGLPQLLQFALIYPETVDVPHQIVYTINMVYEWDENKRLKNFDKHGYDLADGQLVYESPVRYRLKVTGHMNADGWILPKLAAK